MFGRTHKAQGTSCLRVPITIPGSGSNGDTANSLAALTADQIGRVMGCYISKYLANSSTQRPAIQVSDAAATFTNSEYIAAGEEYYRPATQDGAGSYLRSASASTIAAVAVFILTGSAAEN